MIVGYNVVFVKSALKDLESLPKNINVQIVSKIEMLAFEPRPNGCKKLKGEENKWRIRVGDYRVVYSIYDKELVVEIIAAKHRKEVYD